MITDKELREYINKEKLKGVSISEYRNWLEWAIFLFVKGQPTFWESIFGISKKKQELYSISESRYKALVYFGLISSDRKKITAKGGQYYDQIIGSNYVTSN